MCGKYKEDNRDGENHGKEKKEEKKNMRGDIMVILKWSITQEKLTLKPPVTPPHTGQDFVKSEDGKVDPKQG